MAGFLVEDTSRPPGGDRPGHGLSRDPTGAPVHPEGNSLSLPAQHTLASFRTQKAEAPLS